MACVVVASGHVCSAEFGIAQDDSTRSVRFESDAKLEFIEGVTQAVSGWIFCDIENLDSVAGVIQCDLRSLETGIETRDEHMRDRHLHTAQYPIDFFHLTGVRGFPAKLDIGQTYNGTADGLFFIHGVSREIHPALEIERIQSRAGESIVVKAKFQIHLEDYDIPRPKALFLKLAETILVDVSFTAHRNVKPDKSILPEWPLRK
jgi:polyisoprenoid-binding protein YceI